MRIDAYLAQTLPDISRARVQLLIESGQVRVEGKAGEGQAEADWAARPSRSKASRSLRRCTPFPEDIPLEILYEDQYLAVVNKPAGMMVHAGSGAHMTMRETAARW